MIKLKEQKASLNLYDDDVIKWEEDGKKCAIRVASDDCPDSPREGYDYNQNIMACFHPRYNLGDRDLGQYDMKNPEDFWRDLVRSHVPSDELIDRAFAGELPNIQIRKLDDELFDLLCREDYNDEWFTQERNVESSTLYVSLVDILTVDECQTIMEPHAEWLPLWLYDHSGISMSCGTRTYPYNDRWDSGQIGWIITLKESVPESKRQNDDETWRKKAVESMALDVELYDLYLRGDCYGLVYYEYEDGEWIEKDSCFGFYGSDIYRNGMLEYVGTDLKKALEDDMVERTHAKRHYTVTFDF